MPYVEYDETQASCPQCGATFRSPEILEAHLSESHATATASAPKERRKPVRCSVCRTQLSSVAALQRHNREAHVG